MPAYGTLAGLAQRRGEQNVGLGRALVRREIVGPVEIYGIDGTQRDELINTIMLSPLSNAATFNSSKLFTTLIKQSEQIFDTCQTKGIC